MTPFVGWAWPTIFREKIQGGQSPPYQNPGFLQIDPFASSSPREYDNDQAIFGRSVEGLFHVRSHGDGGGAGMRWAIGR